MRPLLVADDHSAPTRVSPTSALVRRCVALRAMAAPILMMGAALIAYGCGNDDRPVRTVDVSAETWKRARQRLECPTPRLALGQALRGVAHACADVSDGLAGDLGHILDASGVCAQLWADDLLASGAVTDDVRALPREQALTCVLAGGDDYELVFTAPPGARDAVAQAASASNTQVTRIGTIVAPGAGRPKLECLDAQRRPLELKLAGFDHFA